MSKGKWLGLGGGVNKTAPEGLEDCGELLEGGVIRAAVWSQSARGLSGSLHCKVEGCGRVRRRG